MMGFTALEMEQAKEKLEKTFQARDKATRQKVLQSHGVAELIPLWNGARGLCRYVKSKGRARIRRRIEPGLFRNGARVFKQQEKTA